MDRTREYWLAWVRTLHVPFDWQEAVIRAAITLYLCSFAETGAIVAALTTSIPEDSEGERNWDYRFCWIRDAHFTVQALNRVGASRTMERFIEYIANVIALERQPEPEAGLWRAARKQPRGAHRHLAERLSRPGAGARRQRRRRSVAA